MASQDKYRLPTNVKPRHYALTVWTDLKSQDFGGSVVVHLDILEETSTIVLNCSDDLDLGMAAILTGGQQWQSTQLVEKDAGRLTVQSPSALPAGSEVQLKIDFNAKLRGSMNGYYKSAWQRDGKTEFYALTHFQPIDARAAFPCWDEPALKASFTVTMISHLDTVNISNMPATSEDAYDATTSDFTGLSKDVQWKITKFQESPPMSTYLVAFANGPFEYKERLVEMPLSGRTVPLRVYATPDIVEQTQFCLDETAKVLPLYEAIFDIEYPLPKLDTLLASDFDMGAMENWGLITGRKSVYMVDPNKRDFSARRGAARVQAHETAHMWFGNITTMQWWDNLYLNEAFATFIGEDIMLTRTHPEWKVSTAFITSHFNQALNLDAKRSSHPIEVECPDANFLNQIFDSLSYSKGAAVLRMLANHVGEDKFLKGVSLYLKAHLYGNTVTRDLWDGISEATGQDIPRIMNNWVTEIGFPLITVTESPNGIHVRQDRFLDSGLPKEEENKTIWSVPLEILTVDKNGQVHIDKTALLTEREKSLPVDTSGTFKLNAGTMGTYRVLYTPDRLSKIAKEATKDNSALSLKDRIGLIYDIAALSTAGLTPLSSLFSLVDIWRNETNYMVWNSAWTNIMVVIHAFSAAVEIRDRLRAFGRSLFLPLVQRLGYDFPDGEDLETAQLRKTAINASAHGRDESVKQELLARFADYMKSGTYERIPADIRMITFTNAARYGGAEEFKALFKIIENPLNAAASDAAIHAVGATENLDHINEIVEYMKTKARDQDVVSFCFGMAENTVAHGHLSRFYKDNYDALSKRFATNSMHKYLVQACFDCGSTEHEYKDVEEFHKDKDVSRYSMALSQVLETIRTKIDYIERSREDLSRWLIGWEERSK
ncbi:leucyl aminopeptidase [Roridomyces roridus]|uniref:Aminopeptidase n=1 Tax=Roridomyces roridus TaxID=1738132 RepID=A0AAD7C822_9AGAR|nr:leucyl aminopeptidase [Roridomyces roridus]